MIDHRAMRRAYLLEIANRLRSSDGHSIVERALAVISKWEAGNGVHPRYIANWRKILAEGADALKGLALSETPEALEMQHCMPFAGILNNQERRALREKH